MADIQAYLDAIENAVYGEDVRGSIHDAIEIINDVGEKVITAGTAVTSPSSSVEGFFEDSLYFNTNTDDLWQCTGTGWSLLGNLKGSQGNPGNPGQAATIAVGTVTKGDNASVVNSGTSSAAVFDFVLPKGDPGPAGVNTWGSITGDIDDQTDLKNALGDVYAQSEELVDRTVGWVCNNLFDIEAVEMGKDIYGEAAANAALFTLNCKPSTRYYLSVHGTNNLQVSYNTTALGPTEVLIASFPYDFSTTEYDTYIKICFTKSGLTKSDIEALKFMLSEVANAPYSEYHPPVSDVITDVYGVMGENGAKNKIPYPYKETTKSINDITFTDNGDGSITVSGIASAQTVFTCQDRYDMNFVLPAGVYKASGCPVGGSDNGFRVTYSKNKVWNSPSSGYDSLGTEKGDGLIISLSEKSQLNANIVIGSGVNLSTPVTFYPMIVDARDTNPDFEPYAMTNRELTDALTVKQADVTSDYTLDSIRKKVTKFGKIVSFDVVITAITCSAWDVVCTVPEGYRPALPLAGRTASNGGFYIGIDGKVQVDAALTNQGFTLHEMWFTS